MRFFTNAGALQGSVGWARPRRARVSQPRAHTDESQRLVAHEAPAVAQYDEDGRLFVFRYSQAAPLQYRIERERIFDYFKRGRLPDMGQRQIRRDLRNRADIFADLRDLQTHPEIDEA